MGQQTSFAYLEYIFKKLKKFVFLAKISKFGFNARSIPVVIKPPKFYTGDFFTYSNIFEGVAKIL